MATFEIQHYRTELVADRVVSYRAEKLVCPAAAIAALHEHLSRAPSEHVVVAYLSNALKPLGIETVAIGGASGAGVRPSEIFRGAILANATMIIVAHNHPSEDASPSAEDVIMTKAIVEAGNVLGIPVLDHVVVTKSEVHSILSDERIPMSVVADSYNLNHPGEAS